MTSHIPFHATPAAGFDQPFEMLLACHERVERMLVLQQRLAEHLAAHGADDQATQAARDVMRYFDLAGPAHHEDEERHVFPALLAQGGAAMRVVVAQLQADHRAMALAWAAVRADLDRVAGGSGEVGMAPEVARRWSDFAALYRRHIAAEEAQAYPAAQPLLDAATQAAMGREMAARRGVA